MTPDTQPDREEALRKLDEESGERVAAFFRADTQLSEAVERLRKGVEQGRKDQVLFVPSHKGGIVEVALADLRTVLAELDRMREENERLLNGEQVKALNKLLDDYAAENAALRATPRFTQEDARLLRELTSAFEIVDGSETREAVRDLASRISQHLEGQK